MTKKSCPLSLSNFSMANLSLTNVKLENMNMSQASLVAVAASTGAVLLVQLFTSSNPLGRCYLFWKQLRGQEGNLSCSTSVRKGVDDYSDMHHDPEVDVKKRNSLYKEMVNSYYDLATVFYEWGWGQSFHFAFRYPNETFAESLRRHEYQLASKLCLPMRGSIESGNKTKTTTKLLDVGCGIGGPMRNICKFTGSDVVGVTLNPYQVQRGNELNESDSHTQGKCKSYQGDFMELRKQFEKETFDGAFSIAASCHAPDRVKCYSQIFEVLKPGAVFATYEWCMTDKYDPSNPEHLRLKKNIEEGNGLTDVVHTSVCLKAMEQAGFEILEECDLAKVTDVDPWYTPLMPSWNPLTQRFQFNPIGAVVTNTCITLIEFLHIAPAGTGKTQKILQTGGFALRDAGKEDVFTAIYLMVGRKPLK